MFRLDPEDPTNMHHRRNAHDLFDVTDLSVDDQSVTIAYTVPPGALERLEAPQPPLERERLAGIDHIVVLMMENRCFRPPARATGPTARPPTSTP